MPSLHGATVSLCMIVRNEEFNLRECLQNVASLFDEIVIVDTGSHDRTRQIAEEFTSRIFDFPWCDDFSAARNESLCHASGDWVFWLDADDRISSEHAKTLQRVLYELSFADQAYSFEIRLRPQFECDNSTSLDQIRLFRRRPEIQWQGRVHEQIAHCIARKGFGIIRISDMVIEHVGYSDPGLTLKKTMRDLRLLRMSYAADPDDESTLLHLSAGYVKLGKRNEAQDLLVRLAKRSSLNEEVYAQLATFALEEGAFARAQEYTNLGLSLLPHGYWLRFIRARILQKLGDIDGAAVVLQNLMEDSQRKSHAGTGRSYGDLCTREVPFLLIQIEKERNQHSNAEQIAKKWLKRSPEDLQALIALGTIYIEQGRRSELDGVRSRMVRVKYGEIFSQLCSIQEMLVFNELSRVSDLLDQVIGAAPNMELPRLLRVAYLERINPSVETYLAACRDVLHINAHNHEIQQKVRQVEDLLTANCPMSSTSQQSEIIATAR